MAPTIVAKTIGDAPAPSHADIASILDTIFKSKTSQESLDAAYALTTTLSQSVGFRGLRGYGVLELIKKAAADKKDIGRREGAMFVLGALFERMPPVQSITEVVFLVQEQSLVPLALDALADKVSSVKESAQYALEALFNNLKPEVTVFAFLPILMNYLNKRTGKWQGSVGAMELIGRIAEKARIGMGSKEEELLKDILREAMGKHLEGLIPIVEGGMHDLKPEVGIYYTFESLQFGL